MGEIVAVCGLFISLMTLGLHFLNRRDTASNRALDKMREDHNKDITAAHAAASVARNNASVAQAQIAAVRTEMLTMENKLLRELRDYPTKEHFDQILKTALEPITQHMEKTEEFMTEVYRLGIFAKGMQR